MGCKCSKDGMQNEEKEATAQEETSELLDIPLKVRQNEDADNADTDGDDPNIPNNNEQVLDKGAMSLGNATSVIDASLLYLRNCDDYSTDEAWKTINQLAVTSCVISSIDAEHRTHLAKHLVKVEFAQIFVKIVTSLQDDVNNHGSHQEESLKVIKGTCTNFSNSDECECLVLALVRFGAIKMLLNEINKLDVSKQKNTNVELMRVVQSLDILSNCVRCPDGIVRECYRNANAVPILLRCLKSNEVKLKMESLSILAYIVNNEESDTLANTEGCISILTEMLNKAATAKYYYVHYSFAGAPCGDGVYALIDTINRLVINDSNKQEVVLHGGIPTMMHILQIQSNTAMDSQQAAIETLWKLAFIESHRQVIIQHVQNSKVKTVLTDMQTCSHRALQDVSTGLLWKLDLIDIHGKKDVRREQKEEHVDTHNTQTAVGLDDKQEHILLSYNRSNLKQILKMRDTLKSAGFCVWVDVDKVEGTSISSMVEAVKKAAVVLVCTSLKYKESVYCQTESSYACDLNRPIIPVLVEEDYVADGWLGTLMANRKQFRACSDATFNEDIDELIQELGKRGCVTLKN